MANWKLVLQGLSARVAGRQWEFDAQFRIGRGVGLEVCLDDPSVSKQHAEVMPTPRGWVVRDLESTNGTFVNGVKVTGNGRRLNRDDVVQCGNLTLTVAALEQIVPASSVRFAEEASPLQRTGGLVAVQAVAKRSWEQGVEALAGYDDQRLKHGKHFLTLLRGGYHLAHLRSPDEMLQSVLEDAVAVLDAQRGAFLLKDPATGQLQARASVVAEGVSGGESRFSATLAKRCLREGQSLLCRDVTADVALQGTRSVVTGSMASIICALVRSPRNRLGVLHLDRGTLQAQFTEDEFHLADAIAASIAVGVECAQAVAGQRDFFLKDLSTLAQRILEHRAPEEAAHARRVTGYALLLAEAMRLPPEDYRYLQIGAPLHDVGKLGVKEVVLQKADPLTPEEAAEVASHPLKGVALVEGIAGLAPVVPMIRHHHERWDGRGYPDGLAGEQIPLLARIVAVADAFEAMTQDQPYQPRKTMEEAFAELKEGAGQQFDPECVRAFLELGPRLEVLGFGEEAAVAGAS